MQAEKGPVSPADDSKFTEFPPQTRSQKVCTVFGTNAPLPNQSTVETSFCIAAQWPCGYLNVNQVFKVLNLICYQVILFKFVNDINQKFYS